MQKDHLLHTDVRLRWLEADNLLSGQRTYVPYDLVSLDSVFCPSDRPLIFNASSNGLASGNVLEEATLHAVLEVIESDSVCRWERLGWPAERAVNPLTIDDAECRRLLTMYAEAGVAVSIWDATGPTEIPCFRVLIFANDFPVTFDGYGCHLQREIALSRALTEAAQARLTAITGTRDDLGLKTYAWARESLSSWAMPSWPSAERRFSDCGQPGASRSIQQDLERTLHLVSERTGQSPLRVTLTKPAIGVPVCVVIVPGYGMPEES